MLKFYPAVLTATMIKEYSRVIEELPAIRKINFPLSLFFRKFYDFKQYYPGINCFRYVMPGLNGSLD
jgi:hypothetical protein